MTMQTYEAPCPDPLDYFGYFKAEGFRRPNHLSDLGRLFKRIASWARGESDEVIRALVTYPIRHWKSQSILILTIWLLEQFPWLSIVIMSHDHERVLELGKRMRELVRVVSDRPDIGPARGWDRVDRWRNQHGGGVIIMSSDQSKEGFDCHVLLCDDPINEKQVKSQEDRDRIDHVIDLYTGRTMISADTGYRQGPVIIVASRFSRDDVTQRRLNRGGWEYFYSPAIIDGKPFAPIFTLPMLERIRADLAQSEPLEDTWYSRWMGIPIEDRGQNKFGEPARYEFLPEGQDVIGVQFSGKTEWFAIVTARISAGMLFVKSSERMPADPHTFSKRLIEIRQNQEQVYGWVAGATRIALRRIAAAGIQVNALTEGQNRLWRAQHTVTLWQAGKIPWPHHGCERSLSNFRAFNGGEDQPNEEVDALVAIVEGALMWKAVAQPEWAGRRRMP